MIEIEIIGIIKYEIAYYLPPIIFILYFIILLQFSTMNNRTPINKRLRVDGLIILKYLLEELLILVLIIVYQLNTCSSFS